jgi:hypothetical protein
MSIAINTRISCSGVRSLGSLYLTVIAVSPFLLHDLVLVLGPLVPLALTLLVPASGADV